MKSINKKLLGWTIIIVIIVAILIQILMTTVFNGVSGASNDGWLSFWGTVLAAIIAIAGISYSLNQNHNENVALEKRRARPAIYSETQFGIKAGDRVYHSTNFVDQDALYADFYTLENLTDNPAINVIFTVVDTTDKVIDAVIIPAIVRDRVLVDYRRKNISKDAKIKKIEIVFETTKAEFGLFTQVFRGNEVALVPEIQWGEKAKQKHQKLINSFNVFNKKPSTNAITSLKVNTSIFTESDVEAYRKILHEQIKEKFKEN